MAELNDPFEPDAVAAAEQLDREIATVLAGRSAPDGDPTLTWLAAATRTDPPPTLAAGVEAGHAGRANRRWRPFRYAAAVMAYLLISQGIGNLFIGDWVADGLGEPHSPHVSREQSFALIAAGIAVAAGAVRRRLASVSVATGAPLGVAMGIGGIGEIGVFAAGAALHLTQGAVAIGLAFTYWRYRRDTPVESDE